MLSKIAFMFHGMGLPRRPTMTHECGTPRNDSNLGIVLFYAVIGGMKGITYTQVAQYCVLIFAFMVPAIYISFLIP